MKKILLSLTMLTALSVFAQPVPAKDRKFAKEAAQAGFLEVQLAEMALKKSSSAEVKTLAQQMITDHTKANNDLRSLATSKSMSLPTGMSMEGKLIYDQLSQKTGADFDKAYTALMVKDHQEVVEKFKTESSLGTDAALKDWATNTLPTLEHHLMMSKDTNATLAK
jgi:putative membrane protein